MKPPPSSDAEPVLCLGGCGNTLRSAKAVARGYGERCWRKLHSRPTRRHRIRNAPPHPQAIPRVPGQTALELWHDDGKPGGFDFVTARAIHDLPEL